MEFGWPPTLGPSVMILGSAPVPYISVWVLIPSMSGGGEVIADALVRGISGIVFGGGLNSGLGAGVGAGVGVGAGTGVDVGAEVDTFGFGSGLNSGLDSPELQALTTDNVKNIAVISPFWHCLCHIISAV